METIERWKAVVAAGAGLLTGLWGWLGWLVVGWVAVMVLDYLTGSAAAPSRRLVQRQGQRRDLAQGGDDRGGFGGRGDGHSGGPGAEAAPRICPAL